MRPPTLNETPRRVMDVDVDVDVGEYHLGSDRSENPTPPPWTPTTTRFGSYTPGSSSNTESHGVKRSRVMFADWELPAEERPRKRLRFVSPCN
jgi:hypothetical protein